MCNNCFKQTNKNKKRHDQQQTLHWEHLHANKHIYLLFNHHFQHWEHLHANSHLKYGYVFSLDQTSKQTTLKVIHVYEEKQTYRARISLSLSLSLFLNLHHQDHLFHRLSLWFPWNESLVMDTVAVETEFWPEFLAFVTYAKNCCSGRLKTLHSMEKGVCIARLTNCHTCGP